MKNGQTTPLAAVEKISMNLIDPFPNHPYHVIDDYEMIELIESIRKNGLIIPITNSTNHTYVNGQMIQSNVETKIAHGAKIKLANEDFEFRLY